MTNQKNNGQESRSKLEQIEQRLQKHEQRIFDLERQVLEARIEKEKTEAAAPPAPPPPQAESLSPRFKETQAARQTAEPGKERIDWEHVLGGNWLVKVGVAALVLGVGFFFKLAFDNNWIGETGRIVLGLVGAFILVILGEYWQKRYPIYAQILTGGGVIILYFTIYAAYSFYGLIGSVVAFGMMALVTLMAGLLALRYGTPTIAVIAILGGFLGPFVFAKVIAETTLIFYTLVLDVGILVLSSVRNWRPLTLIGLAGSLLLFFYWHNTFYTPEKLWLAEGFLTALFLIFAFATILWHLLWQKRAEPPDLALMSANAAGYFGISYVLMRKDYGDWMGFFAFMLAIFYTALAYAAFSRSQKDFHLTLFLGGIAMVFLTIAMPIQLDGNWITIAWAAEGSVLVWLGFLLASYHLRVGGLAVFIFAIVRLLALDSRVRLSDFTLFLNERFFTFGAGIGALLLTAYFYHLWQPKIREQERWVLPIILLLANFLTLWILSAETISFYDSRIADMRAVPLNMIFERSVDYSAIRNLEHAKNFTLSVIWAAYSILLVILGILKRVRVLRIAGLALFWITIFKVFAVDVFGIGGIFRVASLLSLGVILLMTGYLYHRYRDRIKEFLGAANNSQPPSPPSL